MLRDLDARVQRLGCVAGEHLHALLGNDLPGVDIGVDEVDGAAGLGHAGVERLLPRAQPLEGGQQRRVNVDDAMAERGDDFSTLCWSFTEGKSLKGDGKSRVVTSPLSEQISKEFKRRGFKFVGPTIVYAWMQAVGIVNDHSVDCFRRTAKLT